MVMMVTQPGRAPPGTVSCPVEPASAAASMARTSAEMPPAPAGAEEGEPPGILPAAGTVLHHAQRGKVAGGGKNFLQQLLRRHAAGHPAQPSALGKRRALFG